ncbi:hypothetical protein [Chloroflexus sp.]|uniref:hypothetical protein n=1 Tax=Chloroflexus sp. TaxID=1904827 RepID=UPI002ADD85FF|nr:hypothetical protein [Chloroflexus sp.]
MSDLLGVLGQAWPRLLLYPGGLSAVLAVVMFARLRGVTITRDDHITTLIDVLPPLCVLTLLPLAPAASFAYGLDLATTLLLLMWPVMRQVAQERRDPRDVINQYLPIIMAAMVFASITNTLSLSGLLRWPAEPLPQIGYGLGIVAWFVGSSQIMSTRPNLATACSELGFVMVGVLPLSAGLQALPVPGAIAGWGVVFASVVIAMIITIGAGYLPQWIRYLIAGATLLASGLAIG